MPHLTLAFLSSFDVQLDASAVHGYCSEKVRPLLAYLAVEADRPHARSKLAGLLWSNKPEADPLTYLRHALANLRQLLAPNTSICPWLVVTNTTIHFQPNIDQRQPL